MINLAEQLAVYFIVKELTADELEQRIFFFIILAIGFVSCVQSGITNPIISTIVSVLIETGELFAYIFALPRSTTLIIVVSVLSGVEIFIHILVMIIECCSEETKKIFVVSSKRPRDVCFSIWFHMVCYSIYNLPSLLYLFLNQDSLFRETFYEILILLDAFISSLAIGLYEGIIPGGWKNLSWKLLQCSIPLVWYIILKFAATIIFITINISGWILAATEIKKRVDRNQTKMDYDYIIYLLSVVFFTLLALAQCFLLYQSYFGVRNHFCTKVDPYVLEESSSKD